MGCWIGEVADGVETSEDEDVVETPHKFVEVVSLFETNGQSAAASLKSGDVFAKSSLVRSCREGFGGWVESFPGVERLSAGPSRPLVLVELNKIAHCGLGWLESGLGGGFRTCHTGRVRGVSVRTGTVEDDFFFDWLKGEVAP